MAGATEYEAGLTTQQKRAFVGGFPRCDMIVMGRQKISRYLDFSKID
jgi:hypothetical protein